MSKDIESILRRIETIRTAHSMAMSAAYDDMPPDPAAEKTLKEASDALNDLPRLFNVVHNTLSLYSAMSEDYASGDSEIVDRAAIALSEDRGDLARRALAQLGLEPKGIKSAEGYEVEDQG